MLTTCIIIAAWTTGMPLWASITTTVIASIRFVFKCIGAGIKLPSLNKKATKTK